MNPQKLRRPTKPVLNVAEPKEFIQEFSSIKTYTFHDGQVIHPDIFKPDHQYTIHAWENKWDDIIIEIQEAQLKEIPNLNYKVELEIFNKKRAKYEEKMKEYTERFKEWKKLENSKKKTKIQLEKEKQEKEELELLAKLKAKYEPIN